MQQKVVIIGGGFAGIQLAKHLDAKLFDILLIDKTVVNVDDLISNLLSHRKLLVVWSSL